MSVEDEPIEIDNLEVIEEVSPIEVGGIELSGSDDEGDDEGGPSKIQTFASGKVHHDFDSKRSANTTGTGATRVKTFNSKLRVDALEFLDDQVNAWLDAHPEYEVKFVTTTIGILTGKVKEDALFMNVWV